MKFRLLPSTLRLRILGGFVLLLLGFQIVMTVFELFGVPWLPGAGQMARERYQSLNNMDMASGLLAERIGSWFQDQRSDVADLAGAGFLQRELAPENAPGLDRDLELFLSHHRDIQSLEIRDPVHGNPLGRAGKALVPVDTRPMGTPGYRETIFVRFPGNQGPVFVVVRQILGTGPGEPVAGLLVVQSLVAEALLPLVTSLGGYLPRDWETDLVDMAGNHVLRFRNLPAGTEVQVETLPADEVPTPENQARFGVEGPYSGKDRNGREVLSYHRPVLVYDNTQLALVMQMDMDKSLAHVWWVVTRQSFLWLSLMVVGVGVCLVMANSITRPIRDLVEVSRKIRSGDLAARARVRAGSEMGTLAADFNRMVTQLQTRHDDLEKQVQDRTRELRAVTVRQEAVLKSVKEIILELDARKVCIWANQAALDFFGADLVGQPVDDYLVPKVGGTERVLYVETRQNRQDGEPRLLAWWCRVLENDQGEVVGTIASARDVTDKQKIQETLQRDDKMNALGILAGGIAHDFNNLLAGLFTYLELARMGTTEVPKAAKHLEKALGVFQRAKDLTRQLLTFSKGGDPVRKTGLLGTLVRDSTKFALSGSNVVCQFDLADDLYPCHFDENQIGQVIDNLVINAQQAMPDGGTLTVTARNTQWAGGPAVKISVADTGSGIPPQVLSRIFDPFFTTKSAGNGLGLATCYSILQKHGGAIDVESEPGRGTVFTVHLPAAPQGPVVRDQGPGYRHGGSGTVLIMDDEEIIRDSLAARLGAMGYSVLAARDGLEAQAQWDRAAGSGTPPVFAILDLTIIGGMGGRETVSELRKRSPGTPIFASSGYSDDPVMARPGDFQFTASINKPFLQEELEDFLERHLIPRPSKIETDY